jgi:hypothetical protein
MNVLNPKYWYSTLGAVLLLTSVSYAFNNSPTTLELTGVGDGAYVGNVYVDPYVGNINGGPSTYVICDDWSDNSYLNTSWTANVNTVTSLDAGTNTSTPLFASLPFANPYAATPAQLYNEAAYLAANLLTYAKNPAEQAQLSFALWELTFASYPTSNGTPADPQDPLAYLTSIGDGPSSALYKGVQSWLTLAQGEGNYNAQGWTIYTPNPQSNAEEQEFLVHTPESSSVVMLGADLLGVLALAFFFRRRLLLTVS